MTPFRRSIRCCCRAYDAYWCPKCTLKSRLRSRWPTVHPSTCIVHHRSMLLSYSLLSICLLALSVTRTLSQTSLEPNVMSSTHPQQLLPSVAQTPSGSASGTGATSASLEAMKANSSLVQELDSTLVKKCKQIFILVYCFIFITGLCGNTVVILVILKFTKVQTVTDIYILNLALADLMFITGLIFLIPTMHADGEWMFGALTCKIFMAATSLNQFASSLLLVVMSYDRFLAICHPIFAQRFRRLLRAKMICFCIWIISLVLMAPIFAFAKGQDFICAIYWPDHNHEQAFTLYSISLGFVVPLLLIAAFYSQVIIKLRLSASGPTNAVSSRRSRSRESTNKRVEHLVIAIICTYTICWLPYWVTQLIVSFITINWVVPITAEIYLFVLLATSLSYTNSALNPILYAFLSDNFKRRYNDVMNSICSIKWPQGASHSQTTTCAEMEPCRSEIRQTIVRIASDSVAKTNPELFDESTAEPQSSNIARERVSSSSNNPSRPALESIVLSEHTRKNVTLDLSVDEPVELSDIAVKNMIQPIDNISNNNQCHSV